MFFSPIGNVNPFLTNLVAYWKLNSNSNDSSVNMHNGTDTNISYINTGLVNNCATFTNVNSKIRVPQSADFDFSNGVSDIPFSGSLCMYTTAGNGWIISKYASIYQGAWIVRLIDYKIQVLLLNTDNNYIGINVVNTINAAVWSHISWTYSGNSLPSGIKLYINGNLQSTTPVVAGSYTTMQTINSELVISGNLSGQFPYYGRLDEIGIWKNRELTSVEVLAAYNKLLTGQSLIL